MEGPRYGGWEPGREPGREPGKWNSIEKDGSDQLTDVSTVVN